MRRFESLILGFLSVVVIGCSTINVTIPYVDPDLDPYVQRFINEATARGLYVTTGHLTAIFDTIDDDPPGATILGTCERYTHHVKITVDPKHWSRMSDATKEELMFHELGHCILRRGHCDTLGNEERFSIMDSYIGDPRDYELNRDKYVEELFYADRRCEEPGRDSD